MKIDWWFIQKRFAHVGSGEKQGQNKARETNGIFGHLPIDSKACVRDIRAYNHVEKVEQPGTSVLRSEQALRSRRDRLLHKQAHHGSFPPQSKDQIISLARIITGPHRLIAYQRTTYQGQGFNSEVWFANHIVSKLHSYGPVTSCLRVLAQRVAKSSDSPESQLLSQKQNHRLVSLPLMVSWSCVSYTITTQRSSVDIA